MPGGKKSSYGAIVGVEITIRAERRAGELIPEQIEHGGDRKTISRLHDVTLKNMGIEKIQSHRWQAIASVSTMNT